MFIYIDYIIIFLNYYEIMTMIWGPKKCLPALDCVCQCQWQLLALPTCVAMGDEQSKLGDNRGEQECPDLPVPVSSTSNSSSNSSSSESESSLSTDSESNPLESGIGKPEDEEIRQNQMKEKEVSTTTQSSSRREIHQVTRRIAAEQQWPEGPKDMKEMIGGWPSYNAKTLALPSQKVLCKKLLICEAYAGTGNGATTLHRQWRAIATEARRQGLNLENMGQAVTTVSCDVDPVCQKVLMALPQDCVPLDRLECVL